MIAKPKPQLMGIINVTPDSFSDGGLFVKQEDAIERAMKLYQDGASILDIGGESTRPGSEPVDLPDEISRVTPVIKNLRDTVPNLDISIDTYKSEVAQAAIDAGANMINDISSLQFDKKMIGLLKDNRQIKVILMHIQGTPKDMQKNPQYADVVAEIISFLSVRIKHCIENGVDKDRIIVDPGIGFGKNLDHNLKLLRNLERFQCLKVPIMLGASRKSFINKIYSSKPTDRLPGTLATAAYAILNKVDYLRVHDVKEHKQFIDIFYAIDQAESVEN